jgi:FKBP-type peptidyl-prolyl cis-trans isomerase FklB
MNRLVLLILCMILIGFPVAAVEETPASVEQMDDINYSYGFNLGAIMLERQVEFRVDALSDGLYDALEQKPPRLTEEAMSQLLTPEQKNSSTSDETPKNFRLPGQKYISENSSRDGVVSLASGLQYKILKVGKGKKTPKLVDTVLVLYRATSIEGTEFSSTFPLGIPTPEEVPVNKGVAGWREALLLMHEGDRWELTIPARLAYRDVGPMSGQTVIIDLELLEIFSGY